MNKHRGLIGFLVVAWMVLASAGIVLSADKTIQAQGKLTSIETDGTVIIDDRGYELSQSVRILDFMGGKTTLDTYTMPSRVNFEYENTARGPIIKLIRDIGR